MQQVYRILVQPHEGPMLAVRLAQQQWVAESLALWTPATHWCTVVAHQSLWMMLCGSVRCSANPSVPELNWTDNSAHSNKMKFLHKYIKIELNSRKGVNNTLPDMKERQNTGYIVYVNMLSRMHQSKSKPLQSIPVKILMPAQFDPLLNRVNAWHLGT